MCKEQKKGLSYQLRSRQSVGKWPFALGCCPQLCGLHCDPTSAFFAGLCSSACSHPSSRDRKSFVRHNRMAAELAEESHLTRLWYKRASLYCDLLWWQPPQISVPVKRRCCSNTLSFRLMGPVRVTLRYIALASVDEGR